MKIITFWLSVIILLVLSGCGSDDDNTEQSAGLPAFFISPATITAAQGEQIDLDVVLQDIPDSLFALSFRLVYNPTMLTYLEYLTVAEESFFGTDAIEYASVEDSIVHAAVSRKQQQQMTTGTGIVCRLRFEAVSAGTSNLEFPAEQLHFYDETGSEITIQDLELEGASVTIP
ncbi:cohesin domain-containing protein [bacterium]|nr:cohesin domain-containing protein [bacterium]MBU1636252.1 cohesin domain-containing protein [bacterium]MBU1920225.1 cohesin domain-containing protein [bacterium]